MEHLKDKLIPVIRHTAFDLVSYVLICIIWLMVIFSSKGHAFNDQDRCVCAGYDNGDIKLFDLRNMSLRWEKNIKNGVSFSSLRICIKHI